MGEKGNVPADVASASLASSAVDAGQAVGGIAATKVVEATVEGAVESVRRGDREKTEKTEKADEDGSSTSGA